MLIDSTDKVRGGHSGSSQKAVLLTDDIFILWGSCYYDYTCYNIQKEQAALGWSTDANSSDCNWCFCTLTPTRCCLVLSFCTIFVNFGSSKHQRDCSNGEENVACCVWTMIDPVRKGALGKSSQQGDFSASVFNCWQLLSTYTPQTATYSSVSVCINGFYFPLSIRRTVNMNSV